MNKSIIIIAVVVCFLVLLAAGGYYWVQSRASPPPPPAQLDPRNNIWSSGQLLQSEPLEIGSAVVPLKTTPTGYSSQTAGSTYSMSIDIFIKNKPKNWINILSHSKQDPSDWPLNGSLYRTPSVYCYNDDTIYVCHIDSKTNNQQCLVSKIPSYGTWFNLTWVVTPTNMTGYLNGVQFQQLSTGLLIWPSPDQAWTWNYSKYVGNNDGSVQVANSYFWTVALPSDQVVQLKIPSTPNSSVATTSYYTPEPYSK